MRRNKPTAVRQRQRRPSGAIPGLVLVVIVVSLAAYALQSFKTHPFFKVKDVIIREGTTIRDDRDDDLQSLIGKNIFSIDLKKNTQFIQSMYPAYRTARLVKFLPNQMCLDLMKRNAVACINSQPPLYIDDRMIFFESGETAGAKKLPLISGIDTANRNFSPGMRANHAGVLFAVRLIQQTRKNKMLQRYAIERVVVHDAANASLYLAGQLEVRIGGNKLDDSLQILGSLLSQVGNGISNIEYIDLRFKDPVIRFKGKEA
jgi:cell division septal protein FtsQ